MAEPALEHRLHQPLHLQRLYVVGAMAIGLLLAILIDQRVRGEAVWRTIYLYPLAVSFVVTGTVWSWLFNPTSGIQLFVRGLGWTDFSSSWTTNRDLAIYAIVITGIWQASGFAMALFLAGLRSVDQDLDQGGADRRRRHARASIGGSSFRRSRRSSSPWLVVLLQFAIKTFDLVARADRRRPGHRHHLPGDLRLRPHVPARPDRRGRRGGDHDPRSRSPLVLVPYSLWQVVAPAPGERPWLASIAAYDPLATSGTWRRRQRASSASTCCSALFAAYYLLPLVVVILNSFRDLPEIAANGLIAFPHSFSLPRLGRGLEHAIASAAPAPGMQRELLQLAEDDDPGDDHLDGDRRHQRLHPVEMALPRLGAAVRRDDARRVHARADRAAALGVHPRQARPDQHDGGPGADPLRCRGFASRRSSAATTTSTSPTT